MYIGGILLSIDGNLKYINGIEFHQLKDNAIYIYQTFETYYERLTFIYKQNTKAFYLKQVFHWKKVGKVLTQIFHKEV